MGTRSRNTWAWKQCLEQQSGQSDRTAIRRARSSIQGKHPHGKQTVEAGCQGEEEWASAILAPPEIAQLLCSSMQSALCLWNGCEQRGRRPSRKTAGVEPACLVMCRGGPQLKDTARNSGRMDAARSSHGIASCEAAPPETEFESVPRTEVQGWHWLGPRHDGHRGKPGGQHGRMCRVGRITTDRMDLNRWFARLSVHSYACDRACRL